LFPWEKASKEGREFIMSVSARDVWVFWTSALGAVSGYEVVPKDAGVPKHVGGVLVIRYHSKPVGILGSPKILRDILLEWRIPPKDAPQHIAISNELALLADSAKPALPQPFCPSTLTVGHRPKGVNKYLHEQSEQGSLVAILYFQSTYAFLIPLPILARFRREAKDATPWVDSVLNWLYLPDHFPEDSRQAKHTTFVL
jgi:hypothetical protein